MSGPKELRHAGILDAARSLYRSRSFAEVGADEIATLAGVSTATVYNLVGRRDDIVMALVDDLLDMLDERLDQLHLIDPVERARAVIRESIDLFASDPGVYRQLTLHMIGTPIARLPIPRHNPVTLQIDALEQAQHAGVLDARFEPVVLGRMVLDAYMGALLAWAAADLPVHEAHRRAQVGLAAVLAATATPRHRRRFADELIALAASPKEH